MNLSLLSILASVGALSAGGVVVATDCTPSRPHVVVRQRHAPAPACEVSQAGSVVALPERATPCVMSDEAATPSACATPVAVAERVARPSRVACAAPAAPSAPATPAAPAAPALEAVRATPAVASMRGVTYATPASVVHAAPTALVTTSGVVAACDPKLARAARAAAEARGGGGTCAPSAPKNDCHEMKRKREVEVGQHHRLEGLQHRLAEVREHLGHADHEQHAELAQAHEALERACEALESGEHVALSQQHARAVRDALTLHAERSRSHDAQSALADALAAAELRAAGSGHALLESDSLREQVRSALESARDAVRAYKSGSSDDENSSDCASEDDEDCTSDEEDDAHLVYADALAGFGNAEGLARAFGGGFGSSDDDEEDAVDAEDEGDEDASLEDRVKALEKLARKGGPGLGLFGRLTEDSDDEELEEMSLEERVEKLERLMKGQHGAVWTMPRARAGKLSKRDDGFYQLEMLPPVEMPEIEMPPVVIPEIHIPDFEVRQYATPGHPAPIEQIAPGKFKFKSPKPSSKWNVFKKHKGEVELDAHAAEEAARAAEEAAQAAEEAAEAAEEAAQADEEARAHAEESESAPRAWKWSRSPKAPAAPGMNAQARRDIEALMREMRTQMESMRVEMERLRDELSRAPHGRTR